MKKHHKKTGISIFMCVWCIVLAFSFSSHASSAPMLSPTGTNFSIMPVTINFSPRQGGDTFDQAVDIALPFFGSGTTVGFADDYDAACPHAAQGADVCYRFTPENDVVIDVDLWGSQFDTRVFVADEEFNIIGCNDDFYPYVFTSYLSELPLVAGTTYFIVVDGRYDEGEYVIRVEETVSCETTCSGYSEDEPNLHVGYNDQYNGGCSYQSFDTPIQELTGDENGELVLCGKSGWYNYDNETRHDYDWYLTTFGSTGTISLICTQEERAYLIKAGPMDCMDVTILEYWSLDSCNSVTVSLTGTPGSQIWLIFTPDSWDSPSEEIVYEFNYQLNISGLQQGQVATDALSWGKLKAFYR